MPHIKIIDSSIPEPIPLPLKKDYKLRAVTYEVTAHFCPEAESLKSKIEHLLVSDLQKQNSLHAIAHSQDSGVK